MTARQFLIVLLGSVAFGVVSGVVHGNDGGVRGVIGNISTPWLLVALLPAWWTYSAWRGAAVGAIATFLALLGFYLALTVAMLGHLGSQNGQPLLRLVWFVAKANKVWFEAGIISGPLVGAVGGILSKVRRRGLLTALSATLLIAEPALMLLGSRLVNSVGQASPVETSPYLLEAVIGILMAVAAASSLRRRPTS